MVDENPPDENPPDEDSTNKDLPVKRPPELLAIPAHAEALFELVRKRFEVPASYTLDLSSPVLGEESLRSPLAVAAITMRKLQALQYLERAVKPPSHVVLSLLADVSRSLAALRATEPPFRLHVEAINAATIAVMNAVVDNRGQILYFE